jgi:hypothetical protein
MLCVNRPYRPLEYGKGTAVSVNAMMIHGAGEVYRHSFITPALYGGDWSPSRLGRSNSDPKLSPKQVWALREIKQSVILQVIEPLFPGCQI